MKFILSACILCVSLNSFAQSISIERNTETYRLIARYNLILSGKSKLPTVQQYTQSELSKLISIWDTSVNVSRVDNFNLKYLKAANLTENHQNRKSEHSLPLGIYRTKANFFEVDQNNFQLYINPGLNLQYAVTSFEDKALYTNSRSIEIGGLIDNRLAFHSFISENQIRGAIQEQDYYLTNHTLPGAHHIKPFKNGGYDFFTASGYLDFKILPSINLQFGQGRNFIGHGKRSLLLSDFATDYLFLKLTTSVWKINYQNLYAKLIDRYGEFVSPLPSKYLAAHYLGIDICRTLNIGFFESSVFHDNRKTGRGFDLYYLNPIIFYRSVEHLLGDADKMMVGLNTAWKPSPGMKFYGQLMINEFRFNDLVAAKGNANDKYGYQLGLNYINVLGLNNIDFNAEFNRVRPYSYAHRVIQDEPYPVNSYSHYNQPLAHPLGANFSEVLLNINAQPFPKILLEFNVISAFYGADSSGSNWGQNIYLDYRTYEQEFGNYPGQGVDTKLLIGEAIASWQILYNLFLDFEFRYRKVDSELDERDNENIYLGMALRLNAGRRKWEY